MTVGHNSNRAKAGPVNADRLKSFIERIENLEEERKAIGGDIKDVYSEAKGVGYDVATMRKVVRLRGMDAADRAEQETLLEVYMHALGMVDRIDARLAAGQSQRAIAEAEGVSKSTVQRRGPNLAAQIAPAKMDHHPETGEITEGEAETLVDDVSVGGGIDGGAEPTAEQCATAAAPPANESCGGGSEQEAARSSGTASGSLLHPAPQDPRTLNESRSPVIASSAAASTPPVQRAAVVPTGNEGRAGERDPLCPQAPVASDTVIARAPADTRTFDEIVGEQPAFLERRQRVPT